ncbi:unnamed protein product [Nesidiocoris tenuis]|uniref:RING-type E3 ubiquitin transferase n=1 Tax=Nesidiocoris tenuis TaxID=355587 RepID=A0A6H5H7T8_9HEMI|nr:unnamed protein product [Nesidiocoris tenuis]
MGALTSRQNAGVEEVDVASNHAYKYPPKSGNYFGSHFIMGGERFDTPQPEAYLFGENADLNFLGSRPTPFPYPPPQANEPTKTLKTLVNIRKESLRLVRVPNPEPKEEGDGAARTGSQYNIEFIFDCDARTSITIHYFASEEIVANGLVYSPRDPSLSSETFHYEKGANQLFSQPSHVFDPSPFPDEDLAYNAEKEIVPVAIHCLAQEGLDDSRQSHTCIAVLEKHADGTYVLKALKQKLFVDGLCYLLQEIYGIENKNIENQKANSDVETEDNGSECVICMCEVRDTLILPCRHLCLCNSCADSLRYQANNCPICRAPFRALLQIRALQKSNAVGPAIPADVSMDEEIDSEAEKMSPLLSNRKGSKDGDDDDGGGRESDDESAKHSAGSSKRRSSPTCQGALKKDSVSKSVNEIGAVVDSAPTIGPAAGDDSDYYTPDDPPTTILSPLHTDKFCTRSSSLKFSLGHRRHFCTLSL